MLLQQFRQIYIAMYRVDFRKAHSGLLGECYRLGLKPYEGDVVVFVGRCKTKIKVIYADNSGLWLSYKKFDEDSIKTKFSFLNDTQCRSITTAELAMLMEGNAYTIEKRPKNYLQKISK